MPWAGKGYDGQSKRNSSLKNKPNCSDKSLCGNER